MWLTLLLVVGSLLLVVSGFTWAARRDALERARDIERLRLSKLDTIREARLVAVRGRAVADDPTVDPVTDERSVFYEARLVRLDDGERVLRTLRGGGEFAIDDGSGRAQVRLAGAELGLVWKEVEANEGEPSPRMKKLLEAGGFEVPAFERGTRYAIFHRGIRVGDELTVVGTPKFSEVRGTTIEGYRGGATAVPTFETDDGMFIVTSDGGLDALQERERADMRAMSTMLRIAVVVGVLSVVVGAALLIALG